MKAIASENSELDLSTDELKARLDDLHRELGDIKRILVLIQHRAVVLSLLRSEQSWWSWPRQFVGWLRGKTTPIQSKSPAGAT